MLNIDIEEYPAVKQHLLCFGRARLEQTGKKHKIDGNIITSRKRTNNKWFETQDSISYWEDFSKQSIVWGNLSLNSAFAMIPGGIYISAPASMITPYDGYLLAVLNSRVGDWYIRQLGVVRNGGYFEYKPMFVEKLPVPMISKQERSVFESTIMEEHLNYEKINKLIYQIYQFTEEQINYLESLFASKDFL